MNLFDTLVFAQLLLAPLYAPGNSGQGFQFPTANQHLLTPGAEPMFFVGTANKAWMTGGFGCVRTEHRQMHEGIDIRSLQRDRKGEPVDAVLATADGVVAYINSHAGLSNYGKYIILRHDLEGIEVYSLYAHLSMVRPELRTGQSIRAGEPIGIMGRTANTQQTITRDRAHLHFELNLLVNDRFDAWYRKSHAGERNDHGEWNGQNLLGLDPQTLLLESYGQKEKFSLVSYLRQQPELCRVCVRAVDFPWLKRYAPLVRTGIVPERGDIAGYEIALNFNGVPYELIPRRASELTVREKIHLLSVNAAEQARNPCRHLVAKKNGHWELTAHGRNLLELLLY